MYKKTFERVEAVSLKGFVQYLAANVFPHGYFFYVTGVVPEGKDPKRVDEKLCQKYDCLLSRTERTRRKARGRANIRYLRLGRLWVLLGTHGEHAMFQQESNIRDVRRTPFRIAGYSIWVRRGHFLKSFSKDLPPIPDGKYRTRVLISKEKFKDLLLYFASISCHRSKESLRRELLSIPYEPYAPIRRQLLTILKKVNEKRKAAGYALLDKDCIRYHRDPARAFGNETQESGRAEYSVMQGQLEGISANRT